MKNPANEKMRFITRLEREDYKTWWVRIYGKHNSNNYIAQKSFPDKTHGGKQKALGKAKKWRDSEVKKLGIKIRLFDGNGHYLKTVKNKFDLIGITIGKTKRKKNFLYYWRAGYMKNGRQKIRAFSILKYGYKTAFWMAAEVRSKQTGEPLPTKVPRKPTYL